MAKALPDSTSSNLGGAAVHVSVCNGYNGKASSSPRVEADYVDF